MCGADSERGSTDLEKCIKHAPTGKTTTMLARCYLHRHLRIPRESCRSLSKFKPPCASPVFQSQELLMAAPSTSPLPAPPRPLHWRRGCGAGQLRHQCPELMGVLESGHRARGGNRRTLPCLEAARFVTIWQLPRMGLTSFGRRLGEAAAWRPIQRRSPSVPFTRDQRPGECSSRRCKLVAHRRDGPTPHPF